MENNDIIQLNENKKVYVEMNQPTVSVEQRQNFLSIPNDGSITSRLMNTKIVRIHIGTKCACVQGYKKLFFKINTISRRDDLQPQNENELPLFYAEEKLDCCSCFSCVPFNITIELFDANTMQLFSVSQIRENATKIDECCGDNYLILPNIYNYKVNNINDQSIIRRYDTRSFYRTYDHLGQSHYKIGEPYVEKETSCSDCFCKCILSLPCCCCCDCSCDEKKQKDSKCCDCCCCCCCCCSDDKGGCCCCNCSDSKEVKEIDDKRIYIDIFNMSDQNVGKFAKYFNKTGVCCPEIEMFYEVYFPPDSNEMVRLALIAQILFFIKLNKNYFGILPGSRYNLEQFIN